MSDQPVEFKEHFLLQIIVIQITYCETHSNDIQEKYFSGWRGWQMSVPLLQMQCSNESRNWWDVHAFSRLVTFKLLLELDY